MGSSATPANGKQQFVDAHSVAAPQIPTMDRLKQPPTPSFISILFSVSRGQSRPRSNQIQGKRKISTGNVKVAAS
jgi:hypothetical protein